MSSNWCFIYIHGGDLKLQRAVDILQQAGIEARAKGWSIDPVPKARSQVNVRCGDLERARQIPASAGIRHVPLSLENSRLIGVENQ